MTTDEQKPTLSSLRGAARDQRPADAVGAVRAIRDREPTDEQRAAIERLRKCAPESDWTAVYGHESRWWKYATDKFLLADLYLAEHPADGPSVADELREARRLLKQCREWLVYADRCVVNAFLDRTSRFDEQK